MIFTLRQEFIGQDPVVITDKVMRYRGGFSEPIFEIKNWVNYDTLETILRFWKVVTLTRVTQTHFAMSPPENSLILSLAGLNCVVGYPPMEFHWIFSWVKTFLRLL